MGKLKGSVIAQNGTDLVVTQEWHTEYMSWRVSFWRDGKLHEHCTGSCHYQLYDSDSIADANYKVLYKPIRYTDTGVLVVDGNGVESILTIDAVKNGTYTVIEAGYGNAGSKLPAG